MSVGTQGRHPLGSLITCPEEIQFHVELSSSALEGEGRCKADHSVQGRSFSESTQKSLVRQLIVTISSRDYQPLSILRTTKTEGNFASWEACFTAQHLNIVAGIIFRRGRESGEKDTG